MSTRRCRPPWSRSRRRLAASRRRCSTGSSHEVDNGARDCVTTAEAQRVKELEREVKELRDANEILKLASAFFTQAEPDLRLKS